MLKISIFYSKNSLEIWKFQMSPRVAKRIDKERRGKHKEELTPLCISLNALRLVDISSSSSCTFSTNFFLFMLNFGRKRQSPRIIAHEVIREMSGTLHFRALSLHFHSIISARSFPRVAVANGKQAAFSLSSIFSPFFVISLPFLPTDRVVWCSFLAHFSIIFHTVRPNWFHHFQQKCNRHPTGWFSLEFSSSREFPLKSICRAESCTRWIVVSRV